MSRDENQRVHPADKSKLPDSEIIPIGSGANRRTTIAELRKAILAEISQTYREEGTPVHAVAATGTLSGDDIAADDTVTVDGTTYTFVTALTEDDPEEDAVPNEILVGADDAESLDNLIAAINGDAGEGTLYSTGTVFQDRVTAEAGAGDTMDLTAVTPGAAGNEIATTASLTDGDFAESTLEGGIDATVAVKGKELFDDDFRYLAIDDIEVSSTEGWTKTALVAL